VEVVVNNGGSSEESPAGLRGVQKFLHAVLARVAARSEDLVEILEKAPEALIAFDATRKILGANARALALFGYEHGDLDGRSTDVLIPERLRQPDASPMVAVPDLMQVELAGLMRDGTEREIEWCFGAAPGSKPAIFVMTVRDRRELDRTVEALRVSEERFQLLVNGVQDCAIFMLDDHARVSSWNTGAARIKGWQADEILGKPYEVFFTPEDREAGLPAALIAEALKAGNREITGWRLRRDGSRFWAHGSITALRDRDGRVRGFAKVTRDLTERRRAEETERRLFAERAAREAAQKAEQQLLTSEGRLGRLQRMTAALSEAVTPEDVATVIMRECLDGVGATGGAVYLVTASGDAMELLGQKGHPQGSLESYRSIPLDAPSPLADAARARVAAFYESFEACRTKYPELRDAIGAGNFEASAAVPLVARGALVGVLGVRFDHRRPFDVGERALLLTLGELCSQALERARLFAAERQARESAESASRYKDEFLAMLGHELRNPLAPIFTAMHLLKSRGEGGATREKEVIERQLTHLSKLVDDLLDVSRVARGLVTLSREPVEISDVLSKATEIASPLLEQREQHLTVTAPHGLLMNADPLRIAQVVSNLLANAAKYTPPHGHIWLSAAHEAGYVVIRVRDDGEGIGPELLPHVFDLFVQGTQTVARSGGGLGLGLALVKSFVTLHGGTVGVSSAGARRGSEFVVRIPSMSAVEALAPASAVTLPRGSAPGKRILVVDDNDDAREMLAEVLRDLGHHVEVAHDGPAALRQLTTFPAEVAILDIGLPVMDGFELAQRVSELHASPPPRLIALTGYGQERDIAHGRAVGFDAHLVKPVDMSALLAAIDA
jgi:PAS domain S-box-containing protein